MDDALIAPVPRFAEFPRLGQVCRLGLATRGNTHLRPDDVLTAIKRGVNYLNWCSHADGMSQAIRQFGDAERRRVFVASQFYARTAGEARRELGAQLRELGTDYLDAITYFYVEHIDQWQQITARGGAAEVLEAARHDGVVRSIGLTSHQRRLAAEIAQSGRLDMLMIRYNAAHRGAEQEIFPVTARLGLPVVAYTGLRWGALLRKTPDDPAGFIPPKAPEWYRFVLGHPAVTVGLMAPDGADELNEDLSLLDHWQGMSPEQSRRLADHGDRVRRHGGDFP